MDITLAGTQADSSISSNAKFNSFTISELYLDSNRVPGDPRRPQSSSEVNVCQENGRTVMMKEAFQFMYDSSIITIMMIMMTIIVLLVLLLPLLRTLSLMCNLISYLSPIVALGRDEAQSDSYKKHYSSSLFLI